MKLYLRGKLALGLIVLIGMALRLYRLGGESLWYDETVSTALAGSPLPELIRHTAGDIHPPGYYIFLRGWLALTGYPTGHADPRGNGLEFAAGFFSLFFGILLIALVYVLARRLSGRRVAITAAALVAASPYNIWYSQEVRMYTLGAGLGIVAMYALLRSSAHRGISEATKQQAIHPPSSLWWGVYAAAAAAGMYTLYYFAFLLIPLNLWALWRIFNGHQRMTDSGRQAAQHAASRTATANDSVSSVRAWCLANLAAGLLYAPWIPVAWRQATNPPVPPWRTAPEFLSALRESWTALSLGQSAASWLWPILLLTLALYGVGLFALWQMGNSRWQMPNSRSAVSDQLSTVSYLPLATFGPLALILLISLAMPLYHVRYLFTYSPAFYIVVAAGLAWLWQSPGARSGIARSGMATRVSAGAAGLLWLIAAGVTLNAFWTQPTYRADDHRAAAQFLEERWRPGDVVLVNAGWPYTALTTYWQGPIAGRTRLTDELPAPREDAALIIVTTGHVDGDPGLGWADPRSDFFALPADAAERQLAALFEQYDRVWHYRIYDTVNDPGGQIRAALIADGQIFADQVFAGEAYMRVQRYLPRTEKAAEPGWPAATFGTGLIVRAGPLPAEIASGETLYPVLAWQSSARSSVIPKGQGPEESRPPDFATSVRLVGPDGATWTQGPDERPAGTGRQTAALPIPEGTPPGAYTVELVVYDPASGQPWPAHTSELTLTPNGVRLGEVAVTRPAALPASRPALARFGPLALIEANSPATVVAAGGQIPVEILWQAVEPSAEPLVVVVQLLGAGGKLAANLEAEPVSGLHPTQTWVAGELVRDRHVLGLPADISAGEYRLVVGIYRASDRMRLETRSGLFSKRDHWVVKTLEVK